MFTDEPRPEQHEEANYYNLARLYAEEITEEEHEALFYDTAPFSDRSF